MRTLWMTITVAALTACGEDKDSTNTGDAVFDQETDNTDNADGSGCPSVVPEQYWFLWDCENSEGCNGKLYRYGEGESFEDGSFEVTEQWFVFNGPGDYCVDTFSITGQWDDREPSTYGCASCEGMYEVYWEIQESQCGVLWSPFFADQAAETPDGQEYYGYILLDTHGGWDIRNEEMLVTASPVNGNQYAPNFNYARGTATPTYEGATPVGEADPMKEEQQPAEYKWANTGDCLQ